MCVINYWIVTTHGMIQMDLSAENEVDTTNVDPIRNSAALEDTVGTDVAKDDTKPCTFGYAAK